MRMMFFCAVDDDGSRLSFQGVISPFRGARPMFRVTSDGKNDEERTGMRLEFVLHCYTDTCHNHVTGHRGCAAGGDACECIQEKLFRRVRNPLDT